MAARLWGETFPWGTIAINILGSFVIGFFGTLTLPDGVLPASPSLRTFVMVGICGGFTTFSSFSLQTLALARDGTRFAAMGNVALSVTMCLVAVTAGHVSIERIGLLRTEAPTMSYDILAILDRTETAHSVLAAAALTAERLGKICHVASVQQADAKQAAYIALFNAKLPTFMVSETVPSSLGRTVAVAWKPSEAADRAIDAAMPLLLGAERVTVLAETEGGNREAEPVNQLQKLKQASIPVTVNRFQANGRKIGEALIAEAHVVGADLLVMGAYTRSRLAEFILGGATRKVLAAADLPVLMHH